MCKWQGRSPWHHDYIVVPSKLTTRVLALAREGHPDNKSMKPTLQSNA